MKKRILAIPAAAAAIPMKPKIAATNANMKNARAQRSISPPRKTISLSGIYPLSPVLIQAGISAITLPFAPEICKPFGFCELYRVTIDVRCLQTPEDSDSLRACV
jgi:hypothetical protein